MKFFNDLIIGCTLFLAVSAMSLGQTISYNFTGEITQIDANQNNVVPSLDIGDIFSGYLFIDSPELNNTNSANFNPVSGTTGVVYTEINGIDLLFDVPSVYGSAFVSPGFYSFGFAGDLGGGSGPLPTTTFSAFNFGIDDLLDTDGSAGVTELLPDSLDLSEFEVNVFRISGIHIPTGNLINLTGELTSFTVATAIPEPSGVGVITMGLLLLLNRRRRQPAA